MIVAVLIAVALAAQAPAMREPLRPLEFLVGSCWTGTFPGRTATDTHCFESMFGGKFVRDRHVVRGGKEPHEGETVYAWDPRRKQVVYTYWASDGGISTGTMEQVADGLVFPESYEGDGGGVRMRNLWTITGRDSYEVVVSQWKDEGWREMWRMTMRRVAR